MKKIIIFFLGLSVFCLSLQAQDRFNCVDLSLDNVLDVDCVPCDTNGFCIVRTYRLGDSLRVDIQMFNTLMQPINDTSLVVDKLYNIENCNYENGEVAFLLKSEDSRKLSSFSSIIYGIKNKCLNITELFDNQTVKKVVNFHHFEGNLVFSTIDKDKEEKLWFLPANSLEAIPFDFNDKFSLRVLDVLSEKESKSHVFCIAADGKTFIFQTDTHGNSIFANIIKEKSTSASLLRVSKNHYVLLYNDLREDALVVRSANIYDKNVNQCSLFYYKRENSHHLEHTEELTSGKILSSSSSNSKFSPLKCVLGNGLVASAVDVYNPEYQQYYNGYFYDTRFYGFRHQYANVVFYDTNAKPLKYMKVPFNDSQMLHSDSYSKTNVFFLKDRSVLLFFMDNDGFTTQLLDSNFVVIDPARSSDIPLKSRMYKKRNAEIDVFMPWYGKNYFLLTAVQFSTERKNNKVGYIVNKLKFE